MALCHSLSAVSGVLEHFGWDVEVSDSDQII